MQRMFEHMIDPMIERCRPHAITLREEAQAFVAGIYERLDRIADTVAEDDTVYLRRGYPVQVTSPAIPSANFSGAPTGVLWEVPPGETWELEVLSVRSSTGAGTIMVYRSGVEVITASVGTGNRNPVSGNGLRFTPGDTIGYEIASAALVTGTLYAQFRVERPRARRENRAAGIRNPTPDRTDAGQEVQDTQRHVGSWHPGIPVMGPSGRNGH